MERERGIASERLPGVSANIFELWGDGFARMDGDTTIRSANAALSAVLVGDGAPIVGSRMADSVVEADAPDFWRAVERARARGSAHCEVRLGPALPFPVVASLSIAMEPGKPDLFARVQFTTAARAAESALKTRVEFLERVVDAAASFISIFDAEERRVVFANAGSRSTVGRSPEELEALGDRVIETLVHASDLESVYEFIRLLRQSVENEHVEIEFRILHPGHGERWLRCRGSVFSRTPEGGVKLIICSAVDISDRKSLDDQVQSHVLQLQEVQIQLEMQQQELESANERLERLASTDALTGLQNRRCLMLAAEDEFRRAGTGQPASLIMFDVDHFKRLNDDFGHQTGDEVLKAVGATLRQALRKSDVAGRYGGEEFAAVLPGADWEQAAAVAEKIRAAIEDLDAFPRVVTASFGVAQWDPGMAGVGDWFAAADEALYRSKAGGRNRVTATPATPRAA